MKNFNWMDAVIILIVIVCVAIFVKSYGKHLGRMSDNYRNPKEKDDRKEKDTE